MTSRPLPLVLALAVALAATGGCTRDAQAPQAAEATPAPAAQPAAPATADTHAATDAHAADDAHAHDVAHASADADVPVPDGHQPWAPDAPLVAGMARVRAAVDALEADPGPAAVPGHVAEVNEAIGYIFANCKLDPEPDAALHGVLARLMGASRALEADPADTAAVASMRAAVSNYEALFDDPAS